MPRIVWLDGIAKAIGKKAVDSYHHTPGPLLHAFFQGLKRGEWVAADCGNHLLIPPRSPCPNGERPKGLLRFKRGELEWVIKTAARVVEGEGVAVIALITPGGSRFLGGLFHRLCGDGGDEFMAGVKVRPRFRSAVDRRGGIDDIECFEVDGA